MINYLLNAINSYLFPLNFFSYRNGGLVTPSDLWTALEHTAQEDDIHLPSSVTSIMSSWMDNTGYPLLKVTRKPNLRRIIVEQVSKHIF